MRRRPSTFTVTTGLGLTAAVVATAAARFHLWCPDADIGQVPLAVAPHAGAAVPGRPPGPVPPAGLRAPGRVSPAATTAAVAVPARWSVPAIGTGGTLAARPLPRLSPTAGRSRPAAPEREREQVAAGAHGTEGRDGSAGGDR